MALILAIESDPRQAAELAHIVKRRLAAELIIADSFDRALPGIGSRVPDLILVPPLLSPQDDASLRFVLRMIERTNHVQVITTPLFSTSGTSSSARSLLPKFMRGSDGDRAGGCDPEEFAKHLASYLRTAAEKRAAPPSAALPV